MRRPLGHLALALALVPGALAGCGDDARYQVTWSFSDLDGPPSAVACASRGVDAIRVTARRDDGSGAGVALFPCRDGAGEAAVGGGTFTLSVEALDPRGDPFTDPVTGAQSVIAQVVATAGDGAAPARALLTPNPDCFDGVDDDGDGQVDLADVDCSGPEDPTEVADALAAAARPGVASPRR